MRNVCLALFLVGTCDTEYADEDADDGEAEGRGKVPEALKVLWFEGCDKSKRGCEACIGGVAGEGVDLHVVGW